MYQNYELWRDHKSSSSPLEESLTYTFSVNTCEYYIKQLGYVMSSWKVQNWIILMDTSRCFRMPGSQGLQAIMVTWSSIPAVHSIQVNHRLTSKGGVHLFRYFLSPGRHYVDSNTVRIIPSVGLVGTRTLLRLQFLSPALSAQKRFFPVFWTFLRMYDIVRHKKC